MLITIWLSATVYCCVASYLTGYSTPTHPLGPSDLHDVWGMPRWFFVSVMIPWAACGLFTIVYAGFVMKDDDLGSDHAAQLDAEIREEATHGPG